MLEKIYQKYNTKIACSFEIVPHDEMRAAGEEGKRLAIVRGHVEKASPALLS